MFTRNIAISTIALTLTACVNAQPVPTETAGDCPAEVERIFGSMIGEWTLAIQADEGWTGYGSSRISWATDKKCGVFERSVAVFDQESEAPAENISTAHYVYDALSETLKVLTSDDRGYVHIGIAAVTEPLKFEVLKPDGEIPNRQIQVQNIQSESFEWSWNGRASPSEDWQKRLVITYSKAR
ncbi:MAG: hypothetical protein AAGJ51_11445 [Pseudomonadota bacterium]